MPTYRVYLRGRNYLLDFEGKRRKMSFTTSVVVLAESPAEAEREALLKGRSKLRLVLNREGDDPVLIAERVEELAAKPGETGPARDSGFLFYRESGR